MAKFGGIMKLSRVQKLALLALAYSFFTRVCPSSLVHPFFPQEAEKHGVSKGIIGIILSCLTGIPIVVGPFIGIIIAEIGPKKIFLSAITLYGVFAIIFGLLEEVHSPDWFTVGSFISVGLTGIGGFTIYTTTLTYAGKIFPENMSFVIGGSETILAVAEIFALAVSGFLKDWGGFKLPFIIFGILHLLSIPLDIFLLPSDETETSIGNAEIPITDEIIKEECDIIPKSQKDDETVDENHPKDINPEDKHLTGKTKKIRPWHLLMIPPTLLMAFSLVVNAIAWSFLESTLERHLNPLGLSTTEKNMMFMITSIGYAVASPLFGWVADKMERTWILITIGTIGCGVAFFFMEPLPFIGLPNSVWLNAVTLTVITFVQAAGLIPAMEGCLLYTIEAGHEDGTSTCAMVSSLIVTSFAIGDSLGAFTSGFMVENLGYPVSAVIYGAITIFGGIVFWIYFGLIHKPKRSFRMRNRSLKAMRRESLRLSQMSKNIAKTKDSSCSNLQDVDSDNTKV